MNDEDFNKILRLYRAIEDLDNVLIPFNIIKNQLTPLREWIMNELIDEDTIRQKKNIK